MHTAVLRLDTNSGKVGHDNGNVAAVGDKGVGPIREALPHIGARMGMNVTDRIELSCTAKCPKCRERRTRKFHVAF